MSETPPAPPPEFPSETPAAPDPAPAPRKRKWLKRLGILFGVGLLLLVAAPFIAAQWIASEAGGAYLREQIVGGAAGAIEGRVDVRRVSLSGLLKVVIEGFTLTAPGDTEPVVSVERIVVDVRVSALAAKRLELAELAIESPRVRVVQEGGTTNLARATKAREPAKDEPPKPDAPAGEPPDVRIHAPDISLTNGFVEVIGTATPVLIVGLSFDGDVQGSMKELVASLALRMDVKAPVERPFSANLRATVRESDATLETLGLVFGDTKITAHGAGAFDASRASLVFDTFHVAAKDVLAIAPDAGLLGDLDLSGSALLEGGNAKVNVRLQLPSGAVELASKAQLKLGAAEPVGAWDAKVEVKDVAIERLLKGQKPALAQLVLTASGSGTPGKGTAAFRLDAAGSRYERLALDEALVAGSLVGLDAQLDTVRVVAAGVELSAKGAAGKDAADLDVSMELASLAKTRTALQQGLGLELAPMAGSITLGTTVKGTYADPRVALRIASPWMSFEENRVEGLSADVRLDHLPPSPVGSFEFGVEALQAGGIQGRKISAKGSVDGKKARADVGGVLDGRQIDMRLRGERLAPPRPGVERWTFDELVIDALGLKELADQPLVVEFGGGAGAISGLSMSGDLGKITLDGAGGADGPIEGHFTLAGLQLARLPASILPKALGLAGSLSLDTRVSGTAKAPEIVASVKLADAAYKTFKPYAVELDATVAKGRAIAVMRATLPNGGRSRLAVGVPLGSPKELLALANPPEFDAQFSVDDLDLALASHFAPDLPPLAGRYSGAINAKGTYAAMDATWSSRLSRFAGYGVDGLDASLDLRLTPSGRLALQAEARRADELATTLALSLPLDVRALVLGKLPDFMALPFESTFVVQSLDLAWLARQGFAPPDLSGRLAGKLTAAGTGRAPTAEAIFQGYDIFASGYRDVDFTVDLVAKEHVALGVEASLGGQPLATFAAKVLSSAGKLSALAPAELYGVPFELETKLLPTAFARLQPEKRTVPGEEVEVPRTTGLASATFRASGTADEPTMRLTADATQLRYLGQDVGRVDVDFGYRDAKSTFSATFVSKGAGDIVVVGSLPGELGATALLAEKARILERPADIRIDATGFNLALANGLVPGVREIAGTLDMHLKKEGPLAETRLTGNIDLRGAHAALLEYGEFTKVDMQVALDFPNIQVKRLAGRSGSGTFAGTADLKSTDGKAYRGTVEFDMKELPLVQNFQTRAYLTLRTLVNFTTDTGKVARGTVRMSNGVLRVPEQLQKNVQDLDAHPDIEFTDQKPPAPKAKAPPPAAVAKDAGNKPDPDAAKKNDEDDEDDAPWRAQFRLEIPDDFRLELPLGSMLVVGARLDTRWDPSLEHDGGPAFDMEGKVNIVRGTIDFIRKFTIEKGVMQFYPRRMKDPALDIRAVNENAGTKIVADIGGTLSKMTKTFTSEPPPTMSESEILFFLATGQRQTKAQTTSGPSLDAQVADAAASLGLQTVSSTFNKLVLGGALDVFTVESNLAGGGVGRARLGKYLSDRIYVGYQYNPSANPLLFENTMQIEGEYRFGEGNETYGRLLGGDAGRVAAEFLFQTQVPSDAQVKSGRKK